MRSAFRKENIPNILTVLRLVFIVPFLIFEVSSVLTKLQTLHYIALFFLGLSFPTDKLDGHVARRYGWVSAWGKKWDPLFDGLVISLVGVEAVWYMFYTDYPRNMFFLIMFLLIFTRNLFVSQGFKYLERRARKAEDAEIKEIIQSIGNVTYLGKCSTAVQMAAMCIFYLLRDTYSLQQILFLFIFFTGFAFSMYSGLDYSKKGYRISRILWDKKLFPKQKKLKKAGGIVKTIARTFS